MMEYLNSQFIHVVNERIHNKRDREILTLHYVEGMTLADISVLYGLSRRHVARICSNNLAKISKYLDLN